MNVRFECVSRSLYFNSSCFARSCHYVSVSCVAIIERYVARYCHYVSVSCVAIIERYVDEYAFGVSVVFVALCCVV